MKIILKNNIFIIGDSCCGKTYFYKKIFFLKIDIDFYLLYKNIIFKNEFFFRILEKNIFKKIHFNKIIFFGGGAIMNFINILYNIIIYKNISLINQKKKLLKDNFNRPTMKNKIFSKIRFCIRKKYYIKLSNIFLTKCIFCNFNKI